MAKVFLSLQIKDRPEFDMMASAWTAMRTTDHQVMVYCIQNEALLTVARNDCMMAFWNSGADYYMSWDADMICGNVTRGNNIFDMLIAHDKPFVGGLYTYSAPSRRRCTSKLIDFKDAPPRDAGLCRAEWLAGGSWCIHRDVIGSMIAAYPELKYTVGGHAKGETGTYGFFIPYLIPRDDGGQYFLTEDYAFCNRWTSIGGEIWADPMIDWLHVGKYRYQLYPLPVGE